jgi:phosphate transport system substrate-binding protein
VKYNYLLKNKRNALTIAIAITLISCSGNVNSTQNPAINIDGSSTVYPITKAVTDSFEAQTQAEINLNVSGTGGGFEKFCRGETDISNASRPISVAEMNACREAGVAYIELPIAFDALTVVVNQNNDWLDSITTEELATIWSPEAENTITNWNQVNPNYPDRPLNLYAPDPNSGTFDYFTEAIVGEAGSSRNDYLDSEDDNTLVQGVKQDPNSIGYFGLAYYETQKEQIKALAIDSGNSAVFPSRETVEAGEYQPLSRPLFIYINSSAAQKNPQLKEFVEYYLEQVPNTVQEVGYVPLPEEGYQLTKIHFDRGKVGTVFDGESAFNLTIGELLTKQAEF